MPIRPGKDQIQIITDAETGATYRMLVAYRRSQDSRYTAAAAGEDMLRRYLAQPDVARELRKAKRLGIEPYVGPARRRDDLAMTDEESGNAAEEGSEAVASVNAGAE